MTSDTNIQDLIQQAEKCITQGALAEGRAILQHVLDQVPDHLEALNDMAYILFQENQYEDGLIYALKAKRIAPSHPTVRQNEAALVQALQQHRTRTGCQPSAGTQSASKPATPQYAKSAPPNKSGTPATDIGSQNAEHLPQTSAWPKITLVTPTLNQARYIEKTICSVLDQNYPNLEYFIVDGGSTDGAVNIIKRYARHLSWWVSESDAGQSEAINKGLARATGVIFNWLGSDDTLEPGALFKVAEAYRQNPEAAAWVGAGIRLHDNGFLHYISYPNGLFREHIINNSNGRTFYQPACFMNTAYLKQIGGCRTDLHYTMDYQLYIQLTSMGDFVRNENVWCVTLAQPDAKTVKNVESLWKELIQVQKEYDLTDAAHNLTMRLKTGVFNYVMPLNVREQLATAIARRQLSPNALKIPLTWSQRQTICFWADFTEPRASVSLNLLQEVLGTLFERFRGITVQIYGNGGANRPELSSPPHFSFCGPAPLEQALQNAKLCIIAHDGLADLDRVVQACRHHGIPVVTSPEVATQCNLQSGMHGFAAADNFTFAFQCVQIVLDPGVWGNMSAQMLLSGVGSLQTAILSPTTPTTQPAPPQALTVTPQPRVHVLLYTHNKAAECAETLNSLQTTAYNNYKVFLLNNGSTDHTARMFNDLPDRMFPDLERIHLPVNIGAPAARNWLLALPEHAACDYLAYFDDDIRVRPDWLQQMVTALEADPQAGVVGAKILNAGPPKTIQHSGGLLIQAPNWIDKVALWGNVRDEGQFDNISERDYLMGCANLYRMSAIREVGDFDIQFSPTQFDDVDHHLRMRLKGWKVLFHGGVEVWHTRKSGGPKNHNHIANRYKLQMKYSEEQAQAIINQGALKDFLAKHPWVR